ncbi:tolB protein precursor, periplasmic protein involved in the tonb-independent uptake of group A colicins [hydrothermal vent metagenome]|uniref:TolB protein, periplasmic protein involved in the tonb-independent uptake of group A colicins n=1 Tax=hydrothermal vent metagenome TaxID=652676 RepID=A0A1W1BSX2_9ZZZZ
MKILLMLFFSVMLFATDLTIEVKKKVQTLPLLAIEDSSINYDDTFKMRFFKALYADMNVISLFNVDKHRRLTYFNATSVVVQNKDKDYVLRYKLFEDDSGRLNVQIKLIQNDNTLFAKTYKISKKSAYIFLAHAIAYDINKYMGGEDISWIKKRIVFSNIIAPKKSQIVVADYTLTYRHVVLKGGFNIFPKWANKNQDAIYYTSLSDKKPTLKYFDIRKGVIQNIASSDGMIVCSDVSDNGKKILVTMSPLSQPDIYLYDVPTKSFKRLTKYGGIDVGGQFLGNDRIVFVSDRLGYPNIFMKKISSRSVEQLVYYGKANSACSVNGKYIVYEARESSNAFSKNTFNLHLISLKSDSIRRLTAVGINQFPRFSDDGKAILFIKNYKNQSAIGVIRLEYNKNYLFPIRYGRIQSIDW